MEEVMHVSGQGVMEKSLYHLRFAVKLKLFLKTTIAAAAISELGK